MTKVIDETRHISEFLESEIPGANLTYQSSDSSFGYYSILRFMGPPTPKRLLWFKFNTYPDQEWVAEIRNERRVCVVSRHWNAYSGIIRDLIEEFNRETGQDVRLLKITDFTKFKDE